MPTYPPRDWEPTTRKESRTSAFQRIGDVVCPPVGAVVLGALTWGRWHRPVEYYLRQIYSEAEPG